MINIEALELLRALVLGELETFGDQEKQWGIWKPGDFLHSEMGPLVSYPSPLSLSFSGISRATGHCVSLNCRQAMSVLVAMVLHIHLESLFSLLSFSWSSCGFGVLPWSLLRLQKCYIAPFLQISQGHKKCHNLELPLLILDMNFIKYPIEEGEKATMASLPRLFQHISSLVLSSNPLAQLLFNIFRHNDKLWFIILWKKLGDPYAHNSPFPFSFFGDGWYEKLSLPFLTNYSLALYLNQSKLWLALTVVKPTSNLGL